MNPQVVCSLSPLSILTSMVKHHQLIYSLVKRDVLGRYRGSTMGLAWSFLNPLLMLAVYTFVFGIVFQSHWMGGTDSKAEFELVIFLKEDSWPVSLRSKVRVPEASRRLKGWTTDG